MKTDLQSYLDEVKERADKATDTVYALCKDPRKFTMTIPAQEEDTDFVLCNSLDDIPRLLEIIDAYDRKLKTLLSDYEYHNEFLNTIARGEK